MDCPKCRYDNDDTNRFCIQCGSPLPEVTEEAPPPVAQPPSLEREVRDLRAEVTTIRQTLARHGIPIPEVRTEGGAEPAEFKAGDFSEEMAQSAVPATHAAAASGAGPATAPVAQSPQERTPRLPSDLEQWLGGNWLGLVGAVAVAIGMGFFLKLAFDNNWVGESGRVGLGVVVGIALLGAGSYWQRRYPAWARSVTGGGVAVLYLSIFAAFSLYDLIGTTTAFAFMALVTVTTVALALRYESTAIAVLGIIGGFLTPVMLREDLPGQRALLAYVLLLDVGVLGVATFRNWRSFTLLGLLGSLAVFGMWAAEFDPRDNLVLSQVGITLIFLVFVAATTLFHIVWRRPPGAADQSLMVINAAAYFGISYGLLWDDFQAWMGGFALILSLFYGALGYAVIVRSRENVQLSFMALGIALVFLTIAIPVQLGGPWISVAWAVEGAVLMWLAFRLQMPQLRWFGVGVFVIFGFTALVLDTPRAFDEISTPFLNAYLPAALLGIAATYLAAYLLHRNRNTLPQGEQYLFSAFVVAGTVLVTLLFPVQVSGAWIAVTWAVEAFALFWLSQRLQIPELRLFGLGLFGVLLIRVLVFDTVAPLDGYRLVLNQRMLAFASAIASLYAAAALLRRNLEDTPEERFEFPALLLGANFLTIWVLSVEVISAVDSGIINVTGDTARYIKSLTLSLVWAVYGSLLLVLGMANGWRPVRVGGLALLAIPIIKLFLYDSFALEQGYRVAAFLSLGAILLVGGFLYQRHGEIIRGFFFEQKQA
jgi:uncharacterized membrane protein